MDTGKYVMCLSQELRRLMDENLKKKGLTVSQIHALGYLKRQKDEGKLCNQRDLCVHCGNVRASSISNLLQTLEQQGYIVRECGEDAREKHVSLTERGEEVAVACSLFLQKIEEALVQGLDERECEQFILYLKRATQNLREMQEKESAYA